MVREVRPWPRGVQPERLLRQALHRYAAHRRQRMMQRHGGHQRFGHQHPAFDRRIIQQDPADAQINAPCFQRLQLRQRRHLRQAHFHLGIGAAQLADQFRHEAIQGRRHKADAEPAPLRLAQASRAFQHFLQAGGQQPRLLQQKAPGFGQPQGTGGAFEQLHAQFFLELADLTAERRLGDVQPGGGTREAAFFRHGLEVAQVSELHGYLDYIGINRNPYSLGLKLKAQAILVPSLNFWQ
ncbi:hypothetical protein G6F59_014589 [Rhizopus arrhizus]|nr:hypothetical protein G6F59_014589 [Rhizopus arrhizus]